jgi:hypothetical protein
METNGSAIWTLLVVPIVQSLAAMTGIALVRGGSLDAELIYISAATFSGLAGWQLYRRYRS